MFRFLVLSVLLACAFGNVVQRKLPDGRIVGGEETTIEAHPHQVSMRVFGSHMCGGSVIASNKVLTAAHCCSYPASYCSVVHSVTNKEETSNAIKVAKVIRHPGYNSNTIDNDVCVLILDADIPFSNKAQPIELTKEAPSPGSKAVVTGWGTTTEGGSKLPSMLQAVEVNMTDAKECNNKYAAYGGITDSMVCAGVEKGGKDACQGDSGGPLVLDGKLVGVVSWGVGCARPDYPGVYANVAHLRSWIDLQ